MIGGRNGARRPMIGTSWKMNLLPSTAPRWYRTVVAGTGDLDDRDLFVLPPFPMLPAAQASLRGTRLRWGSQDVHASDSGPHTGDVSAPMLADLGCTIAEIGHSERRRDHGERNSVVRAKVRAAMRWGLTPLVCVGEQRPGSMQVALAVVARQLRGAFDGFDAAELDRVVVAYEPVWAIGDGARSADAAHVGGVHLAIRRWLDRRGGTEARVLYGGSVDASNAPDLLAVPYVDGLFVGRAALDPTTFVAIATLPIASEVRWNE